MPLRAPPFRVGAPILALGLLAALATAVAAITLTGRFHVRGERITVPADLTLELDPGERIVVLRELAGTHATANNPVQDPPEDLSFIITDANNAAPIPTEPNASWMRQSLFGLERHRTGLIQFQAPDHGRVRIAVTGSFDHPQVYYIGPDLAMFTHLYARPLTLAGTIAAILIIAGAALITWRATTLPDILASNFE